MHASALVRRRPQAGSSDLCSTFCSLYIAARGLSTSTIHHAEGGSNNASPNPMHSAPPGTTKRSENTIRSRSSEDRIQRAIQKGLIRGPDRRIAARETPESRVQKAKEAWTKEQEKRQKNQTLGGLAADSIFADEELDKKLAAKAEAEDDPSIVHEDRSLAKRSPSNMAARLDPKPNARARWARMMVIRNIRHRGRISRNMRIARTERSHTSRSPFFKTSLKKLGPLARQIAGKSIDEAILQMRFSTKKAAREVHKHLLQARNEAIVIRGMGLPDPSAPKTEFVKTDFTPRMSVKELIQAAVNERTFSNDGKVLSRGPARPLEEAKYKYKESSSQVADGTQTTPTSEHSSAEIKDPSNTAPLMTQRPSKALQKGIEPGATDIYIDQAWVNRGRYSQLSSPRARGRQDILRPPHTGISVLLKEEKTRTREKMEKEIKAIRKRMNGKVWTQLPDRPVTRQSQYVLW